MRHCLGFLSAVSWNAIVEVSNLFQFELVLQSGNAHLELARLEHGFIRGANEGEIIRP